MSTFFSHFFLQNEWTLTPYFINGETKVIKSCYWVLPGFFFKEGGTAVGVIKMKKEEKELKKKREWRKWEPK